MCGICGIINTDKSAVRPPDLKKMNDALSHRGPDDEGFWIEKNIGLAQRRLSILDLSPLGHQPMFYDNLVIVFNGEIYNYVEIREELRQLGYRFRSGTDTEVILAAYKEWGTKCLDRFNGMWAFVIYDRKKNLIFAARDRMGVKPFYYFSDKDKFLFASEIKAILQYPGVKAKQNEKIVWDYLISGLADHSEETFFEEIYELRGGHFLTIDLGQFNPKPKISKYWDLDPKKSSPDLSDYELQIKFRELFFDSVRLRLRSDVPIGTCLSGGLDSSAIVCVINDFLKQDSKIEQIGKWQKTFSAAYDDKKYKGCDERKFINEVIKKTKVKSHLVFPSGEKLVDEIKDVIYHQDYPFCSTSIYAQWNVFRLAKQNGVKVILDGQGSDELLAGYHPYFGIYFSELIREFNFPRLIYESIMYSRKHERKVWSVFRDLISGLARRGILGAVVSRFMQNKWPEYDVFRPEWKNKFKPHAFDRPSGDFLKDGLHNHLKYSITSLLRYEDRDSMAFGIESRVPFLDYRFVEFVYSLADNQKIRQGETKWIMREALKGVLPEKIRTRQDKIGFATPEEYWMKQALGKDMKKVFASEKFNSRGYFEKGKTSQYFEEVLAGKYSNYQLFWRLYNFEMWMRVFIDK